MVFGLRWLFAKDETPQEPDPEANQLDNWAESIHNAVVDRGFESAFIDNVHSIAEVAHKYPHRADKYVAKWISADNQTENLKQSHTRVFSPRSTALDDAQRDRKPDKPVLGVNERDGTPVKVYRREVFKNWGNTVENEPGYTFVPKTKIGVINCVKFAIKERVRVRASGSRHSWSNVYGSNGDIVISMMEIAAAVPESIFAPKRNPQDNELERVQFDGTFIDEDGKKHGRIRLGGAATSEHFRQWALSTQGGNWEWMIRALPILTAITSSGWTQVICHGAGINHQSVSDLVVEMEIVNCKGEIQVITDKEQIKAASGGFGLMGIILSQVFVLDPLKIAKLFPKDVPTPLAVPPVSRDDVPKNPDFDVADYSDSDLKKATHTFAKDAQKFYSEFFWFPFQKNCWVNCWDTENPTNERPSYPDKKEVHNQEIQASLARLLEVSGLLGILNPEKQARLLAKSAMLFLPNGQELKTSVCDAIHFRRGIHRMPVRDCEMEIEIPGKADGSSDWSIVQKAWWMAITEVYESLPHAPMRTTLEMRIVGDSDTTMSTQRGYDHGTCSIEVLTNTLVEDDEWCEFIQRIVDRWASLKNPLTGEPLKIRPHFAKEWPKRVRGVDIMDYLKDSYKDAIPEFRQQMQGIAIDGGYSFHDSLKVFGNDTVVNLIGGVQQAP